MPKYLKSSSATLHTSRTTTSRSKGTPTFWSSSFQPLPDEDSLEKKRDAKTRAGKGRDLKARRESSR